MHWTGGCSSTGARWDDSIVESEETLPESGAPGGIFLADEGSDAFRPEPLSDEPRTGRESKLVIAPPTDDKPAIGEKLALAAPGEEKLAGLGEGKHDAAIMDLDANLPSDAAPLLVPSESSSSPLAAKLDEENMKREEAQRAALVADNDRLLAEATASLMTERKAEKPRTVAKAKKARRAARLAKRSAPKKSVRVASAAKAAPVVTAEKSTEVAATEAKAPIERWKPTLPPMVASADTKSVPPAPDKTGAAAETKPLLAAMAPLPVVPAATKPLEAVSAAAPAPAASKVEAPAAKKQPMLASPDVGSALARHVGLLLMGLGGLVLLCLFFLSKSRRDNEPMDW
jgi:hypothetical protein